MTMPSNECVSISAMCARTYAGFGQSWPYEMSFLPFVPGSKAKAEAERQSARMNKLRFIYSTGFQPVPRCASDAVRHGLQTRATADGAARYFDPRPPERAVR